MGCLYNKDKEKKLIEMLILNRKNKVTKNLAAFGSITKISDLENSYINLLPEKDSLKYKTEFLNDTNNENNLMKYLKELKKNNIIFEYEKILLLYFNVLSCKNKTNLTQINNFISYIDKFEILIDDLYKLKDSKDIINDIKCGELIDRYILFEKGILLNVNKDRNNLYMLFNQNRNEFDKALKSLLTEKIYSKVTLNNKEVYFQSLINYYITKFINNNADRTNLNYIYKSIKNCISEIKYKEKFTEEDNRVFFMIFFAPIISSEFDLLIKPDHFPLFYHYEELNGILYVKEKNNNNIIFKINEGNKIDVENLNKQLANASITNVISKEKEEKIIINSIKLQYFQFYNFYTKNKSIWDFNIKLMKYIFQSSTMKSLFFYAYPEVYQNSQYIFNNSKILEELINSIIFVPYKINDSYASTLKDFLIIFINGLPPRDNKKIQILNSSSSFQILGVHEGAAHWTSAYCSFALKNNAFFNSVCYEHFPLEQFRKEFEKNNLTDTDGGEIFERLLFSRTMTVTDIREMLFILCRSSYNGTYISFNKNFQNISKIDLETVYNEVIKDNYLKEYLAQLEIDLDYLKSIKNRHFEMKMKRNGKFIRNSLCNKEVLRINHIY